MVFVQNYHTAVIVRSEVYLFLKYVRDITAYAKSKPTVHILSGIKFK